MRESLPGLLDQFGLPSNTFASAKDFLKSRFADKTDCMILDIAMPGMSGPELRPELVMLGHIIPTIFISANVDSAAEPDVRSAVACLIKPFSDSALLKSPGKALNSKSTD